MPQLRRQARCTSGLSSHCADGVLLHFAAAYVTLPSLSTAPSSMQCWGGEGGHGLYGGGNKGGQGFHAAAGDFDDACFFDGLRFSDTCSCDASCCDACWLEQSSYSSHMLSFSVRLNSKPMHHLLATSPTTSATASPAMLLALWHAKLQSASVAFRPKLPLLSS
eukprot:scaffold48024_cov57-Phaeocystis_antarctica.AAC.5